MKHSYFGNYGNLTLKPLDHDDIEYIRIWRNDKDNSQFLTPINYISEEMQEKWYSEYIVNKDIITFGIFENTIDNKLIGSVSIYNFRGKRAEIGKIQIGEPSAHGKGYGRIALVIASKIAFELMNIEIIDGAVHQNNIKARTNDLKIGFKIVGSKESLVGGLEDIIELTKEQIMEKNAYYDDIEIMEEEIQ